MLLLAYIITKCLTCGNPILHNQYKKNKSCLIVHNTCPIKTQMKIIDYIKN